MLSTVAKWKRDNKPASCTEAPWEHLIPFNIRADVMLKIKQESIDKYGHDLNECPKRKVCMGKTCMGRPLPYLSKTARPYLKQLEKKANIVNNELIIATNCSSCPMVKTCINPCGQINDFINRQTVKEPLLVNFTGIENLQPEDVLSAVFSLPTSTNTKVPWDCLTKRRKKVIETYLFKQRDFLHTAKLHGLNNQASAKYEFYAALTKLSEFAIMRKFLSAHKSELSPKQLYVLEMAYHNNKSFVAIAKKMNVSPQAVQQIVSRLIKNYGIKWTTFVRRNKGKLIYAVPEIFK